MSRIWRRFFEHTIIVVGISSFWPVVLGYEAFWYQCLLVLVALGLAALALVRFRRVKQEFENAKPQTPDNGSNDR